MKLHILDIKIKVNDTEIEISLKNVSLTLCFMYYNGCIKYKKRCWHGIISSRTVSVKNTRILS